MKISKLLCAIAVMTLKYTFEENWANDIMKLRQKYALSIVDVSVETTGMNEWKYLIKNSVKNYALRCLTKACNENKKAQHLEYDKLLKMNRLI